MNEKSQRENYQTALYHLKQDTIVRFQTALDQIQLDDGETVVMASAFCYREKTSDQIAYDLYIDIIRLMIDSCEGSKSDRLKNEVLQMIGTTSQTQNNDIVQKKAENRKLGQSSKPLETYSSQLIVEKQSSFAHEESKKKKKLLGLITREEASIAFRDQSKYQVAENSSSISFSQSESIKKARKRDLKSSFKQEYRMQKKQKYFTEEENTKFEEALQKYGQDYPKISQYMGTRNYKQVRKHYYHLNYTVEFDEDSGLYTITSGQQQRNYWNDEERSKLEQTLLDYGKNWDKLEETFPDRSYRQIKHYLWRLAKELKKNPSTKGQQLLKILQTRAKYRKAIPILSQESQNTISLQLESIYEKGQESLTSSSVRDLQFLENELDGQRKSKTHDENSKNSP